MTKKASHSDMYELVLSASYDIRRRLKIDDSYSTVSVSNEIDPRTYYLHNVLNEVDKAMFSVMSKDEFLLNDKSKLAPAEEDKQLDSKILQSKIDELSLWYRKLAEILVDLIGFRRVNSIEYYQHYNVLHELSKKQKELDDQIYLWNYIDNMQIIQNLKAQAEQLAKNLDVDMCWFAQTKNKIIQQKSSSTKDRFTKILPQAKDHQRAIILSYKNSFGKPSELLHPQKTVDTKLKTLHDFEQSIRGVSVLALYVISAIKDLLPIHNVKGPLKQIANVIKNNSLPLTLLSLRNPKIVLGDFVLTPKGPAQVVKFKKEESGSEAFFVEYLIPSVSNIKPEKYGPEKIKLFAPKKIITIKVLNILQKLRPGIKATPQEIDTVIRKSALDLYTLIQHETPE